MDQHGKFERVKNFAENHSCIPSKGKLFVVVKPCSVKG